MRNHSVLVVLQARMGSTRLPGKVLRDLGGRSMLGFQLARLKTLADQPGLMDTQVVVATSDLPGDDPIEAEANAVGFDVVRGSESDVLSRYALALEQDPGDLVVRLTGDCPFTDPAIVANAVALHRDSNADYTSNVFPRSFPKGLDVEVISGESLMAAHRESTDLLDREHVTPFIYRRPSRFRLANLHSGFDLGEEGWTVDTLEDLERVRAIMATQDDPINAGWKDFFASAGAQLRQVSGEVHLRPLPHDRVVGTAPATPGWPRQWEAVVDQRVLGTVTVIAGDGLFMRHLDVPDSIRAQTETALERLLRGDQQTR